MKTFADIRHYFERAAVAHIATLMPDGAPHSVPVWVGVEGDLLAFFTGEGTTKDRNLLHDPRVAISVTRPDQPLDMAFVRGTVDRRIEGDEVLPIIDRLSIAYTGQPYGGAASGSVVFLIRPERSWSNDYSGD